MSPTRARKIAIGLYGPGGLAEKRSDVMNRHQRFQIGYIEKDEAGNFQLHRIGHGDSFEKAILMAASNETGKAKAAKVAAQRIEARAKLLAQQAVQNPEAPKEKTIE